MTFSGPNGLPTERAHDAFISYAREGEDLAAALSIHAALEAKGLSVWRDQKNLGPGQKFFDEIVTALEHAKTVVALISRQSVQREWVIGELFTGRAFDKLIPVLLPPIEKDEVPFGIADSIHCGSVTDIPQARDLGTEPR